MGLLTPCRWRHLLSDQDCCAAGLSCTLAGCRSSEPGLHACGLGRGVHRVFRCCVCVVLIFVRCFGVFGCVALLIVVARCSASSLPWRFRLGGAACGAAGGLPVQVQRMHAHAPSSGAPLEGGWGPGASRSTSRACHARCGSRSDMISRSKGWAAQEQMHVFL